MSTKSLRILLEITWPDNQVSRLWDGSGPYVDAAGNLWKGAALITGLDALEQAINGDAAALNISLSGVAPETADRAWAYYQSGNMVGATVRILLQPCDEDDQPSGATKVVWSGRVDNILFDDGTSGDRPSSTLSLQVVNRFTLRRAVNGASLSDADQRARAARLNPGAAADRFAERVVLMQNKAIVWPRFS